MWIVSGKENHENTKDENTKEETGSFSRFPLSYYCSPKFFASCEDFLSGGQFLGVGVAGRQQGHDNRPRFSTDLVTVRFRDLVQQAMTA
jgi:hypothetical protein